MLGSEYDFARAEKLVRASVSSDVEKPEPASDVRALTSASDALERLYRLTLGAIRELPVELGGLRLDGPWPLFHPLIRILRRARSHPSWREQEFEDEWSRRAAAVINQSAPLRWSPREVLDELVVNMKHFLRDAELPANASLSTLTVPREVRLWFDIFSFVAAADEVGVLTASAPDICATAVAKLDRRGPPR